MGCFSWMFADINNRRPLRMGNKGYVLCPDNTVIFEPNYDGYGEFDGRDVYELVVDWNREHLVSAITSPEIRASVLPVDIQLAKEAEKGDKYAERFTMKKIMSGEFAPYMKSDWKRHLGISIACYDADNARLPFPIKIVSKKGLSYSNTKPSKSDPNQGM